MRYLKLATLAVIGMVSAVSLAEAQSQGAGNPEYSGSNPTTLSATGSPVTDASEPRSTHASNITPEDTRSPIAPALPAPMIGENATPADYLRAARDALIAGRTGEAQQSLEMAETRVLTRTATPATVDLPDANPEIGQIQQALKELGDGNRGEALRIMDTVAD